MIKKLIGIFTDNNENKINKLLPLVETINSYENSFAELSDKEIKEKTEEWKKMFRSKKLSNQEIENKLNEILPQAYALVREAAKRTMNQSHRDVQLMAGIVLNQGKIAEQKTGEGKTLTATLALYLNSLAGKGAHLVTPNDYLSKHGVGWYGPVYTYLGVSVGVIVDDDGNYVYDPEYDEPNSLDEYTRHLRPSSRKEAYLCDITYGTNHQFGFDYLRDNMASSTDEMVQVNPNLEYGIHNFVVVDEVDNVLIDIARTPLIISSQKNLQPSKYVEYANLAAGLIAETDYEVDEKDKIVTLTEIGISKVERKLGVVNLYEKDFETIHHIENALKAKVLHLKDRDYVVKNGEIVIVDQNTGRLLSGNRWSNGLHQAVEAKEGVQIRPESKTVASISYQNYFRLYNKISGMTGTAITEAEELFKFYSLDVAVIPTYRKIQRIDNPDIVYKTESAKFRAVARDIAERNKKGQPVLVGTTSVERSQQLSKFLNRLNIKHEILNAKNYDREALIIAQAGVRGSVTVSTNMAGRGVDIILGGDPFNNDNYKEVIELGGLYVIGTERHDSRRIDNQLRGRSGRQGDVGESRFYLSLQDDLLKLFGGEKVEALMGRFGVDENMPIEAAIISRSIENAQKKVEGINFDRRKHVVEYDDVMNVQRETIYSLRRTILFAQDKNEFFEWIVNKITPHSSEQFLKIWEGNLKKYGENIWFETVKKLSLRTIDVLWMDHIDTMDDLSQDVRLRAYGQIDPLIEYKREGKELFERLIKEMWTNIGDIFEKIDIQVVKQNPELLSRQPVTSQKDLAYQKGEFNSGVLDDAEGQQNGQPQKLTETLTKSNKIGRNDPCWCGSGKKYKKCHYPN
jgi:preprotein translocase subunit SecA